ncbi:MAG: hypothetical protein QM784_39800 [Polyangiaceae bacterium]
MRLRLWFSGLCSLTLFAASNCANDYTKKRATGACTNAKLDEDAGETDVDCGGADCLGCAQGKACGNSDDCDVGLMCRKDSGAKKGIRWPEHCTDKAKNGDETDQDCGGSCNPCEGGEKCEANKDCESTVCSGGTCTAASCSDGVKNQGEVDKDCGDPAGVCKRCTAGQVCTENLGCESQNCKDGRCAEPSCSDGVRNGTEGDVDCGGSCPNRCEDAKKCRDMTDCKSGVCLNDTCAAPTCNDSVKNGTETGKDCGGPCATKCAVDQGCATNADCVSNSCSGGVCVDPSCSNNTKDGTETDKDCGGSCKACDDGSACLSGSDCASARCVGKVCASVSCNDLTVNGLESDVDCGGDCVTKCAIDQKCLRNADCASGKCNGGLCQTPSCTDSVRNDVETDVDCGGAICVAAKLTCANGKRCQVDDDCTSHVCNAGTGLCQAQSCTDNRLNQNETDVDCGGSCGGCATNKKCLVGGDCTDKVCGSNHTCSLPSCTDEVKNGQEGGKDCGVACAGQCKTPPCDCAVGSTCNNNEDCAEKICGSSGFCLPPSCTDKAQNGTETDTDCGGSCTTKCAAGQSCSVTSDCAQTIANTLCTNKICTPPGCTDKIKSGQETDVDCGGPQCTPCALDKTCKVDSDCDPITSGNCDIIGSTQNLRSSHLHGQFEKWRRDR